MTLKHIVMLVDGNSSEVQQRVAFDIARRHEARVHGVHVMPPPPEPRVEMQRGVAPASLTPRAAPRTDGPGHDPIAASERRAEDAKRSFEQALTSASVEGEFETLVPRGSNRWTGLLEEHLVCDLLVCGKPSDSADDKKGFQRFVTESGTAVLVVPGSTREWSGRNVAIGWNASPEVKRSVRAALPLIEDSDAATIMMVKPTSEVAASAKRLQQVLSAHGVECEEQRDTGGDLKPSSALISRAATSDMLVVGAYGRSRLHEMILGGTTRNLVEQATMPVLLSH